jgi:hypothetical protein
MNGGKPLSGNIICGYALSLTTTYFLFRAKCRWRTLLGPNDRGARKLRALPIVFENSMLGNSIVLLWYEGGKYSDWRLLLKNSEGYPFSMEEAVCSAGEITPRSPNITKLWKGVVLASWRLLDNDSELVHGNRADESVQVSEGCMMPSCSVCSSSERSFSVCGYCAL